jgi:pantoate kinase
VTVRAFAPGHLSAVFRPELNARDPRGRGSIGAGIVLELGAWAEARWTPSSRRRVVVRSAEGLRLPISREVATRLSAGTHGTIEVRLHHELPIGQGFGMSAAGALATALGVGGVLGISRSLAVETAHLADLYGGGGLGGVAAILGGGMDLRDRAGIPPWGSVRHRSIRRPIYLSISGAPILSPRWLRDPRFLDRVRRACGSAVDRIHQNFHPDALFLEGERFTDRLGIASRRLQRTLRRLRSPGVRAGQAMLGRALYATPSARTAERGLQRTFESLGLSAVRLRPAIRGAHVLPSK